MNYITQLFNLEGKVAAITGGAGFLCSEMARGLSKVGCKVIILDCDEKKSNKVIEKINNGMVKGSYYKLDVSSKTNFQKCLKQIVESYNKVDILINGAGINAPTSFFDISEKEWDDIMSIQLKGTLFGCQVFGEEMVNQGFGSIINISSASAGPPLSKAYTYSVAKAGIKNLTQNLAREWGTKGVRVNALRPGFFPTEWSKNNFITSDREAAILNHTPMKRYGKPEELVSAVLWLASDASSFVTGAEITIDGGFSAMTI